MDPLDTGQYMHTGLFSKENPLFQPITKKIAPNSKQVKSLMSPFNQDFQFLFLEKKKSSGYYEQGNHYNILYARHHNPLLNTNHT